VGIEIFHANVVHDDFFTGTFLEEFREQFRAPLSLNPSKYLFRVRGVMSGFSVKRVTGDSRALLDDQRFRLR
jgi:hypothetical protein